jgi:hypothetical protein
MFNVGLPAAAGRGPRSRMCYICGRQTLLAGYDYHVEQCRDLFIKREALKPKKERRPVPQDPMIAFAAQQANGGGGKSQSKAAYEQAQLDAFNAAAEEAYQATLAPCRYCGRKFLPEKLVVHNRSCTADNPAKSVGGPKSVTFSPEEIQRAGSQSRFPSIGVDQAAATAPALFGREARGAPPAPTRQPSGRAIKAAAQVDTIPAGRMAEQTYEEFEKNFVAASLMTCPDCGRHFNEQAFQKHAPICRKVFVEQRKVFDSSKARIKGTELEAFKPKKKPAAPNSRQPSDRNLAMTARIRENGGNTAVVPSVQYAGAAAPGGASRDWKAESNAFRAAIRAARQVSRAEQQAKATGVPLRDLLPAPRPAEEDPIYATYVTCPHCNRKYNQTAGARHIPKCKDIFAKPSRLKSGTGKSATTYR